jgi:hypothetical protein
MAAGLGCSEINEMMWKPPGSFLTQETVHYYHYHLVSVRC